MGLCQKLFEKAEAAKTKALFHDKIISSSLKCIATPGLAHGRRQDDRAGGLQHSSASTDQFRHLGSYILVQCLTLNCKHYLGRLTILSVYL